MREAIRLVGRSQEFETLLAALESASAGEGSLCLVAGDAGIGKTRVAGRQVLAGSAYEIDGTPPYLPFSEALRRHTAACPAGTPCPHVEAADPALALLLSDRGSARAPGPAAGVTTDGRFQFFEAVAETVRAIAAAVGERSPGLLLILDDLHWADTPSLLLLVHLALRLRAAPVALVGAYRTPAPEPPHPLAAALADFTREHLPTRLFLAPLDRDGTAALIEQYGGGAPAGAVVDTIHRDTAGNPLFIREYVRDLRSRGHDLQQPSAVARQPPVPEGVRELLHRRLARLDPTVMDLLHAGAVLGDGWRFDDLVAIGGGDETALLQSLDGALAEGMLREAEGGVRFSHPLVRRVVYDDLSLARRQRLHRRAAEALEQAHGEAPGPHLAALAGHYRLAGGADQTAIRYARLAGDRALTIHAYEDAARQYQFALDTLAAANVDDAASVADHIRERCDLLLALAAALLPAGQTGQVLDEVAPAAFEDAESVGDDRRALAACRLALQALHRSIFHSIERTEPWRLWVARAERYTPPGGSDRIHLDVYLGRGPAHREGWEESWVILSRALALARQLDEPETLFRVALEIILLPWPPVLQHERRRLVEEFLARPREGVSTRTLGQLLWRSGLTLFDWGERERAEALWREVANVGQRTRDRDTQLWQRIDDPIVLLFDGRLREALAAAEAACSARDDEAGRMLSKFSFAVFDRAGPLLGRDPAVMAPSASAGDGQSELFWTAAQRAAIHAKRGHTAEASLILRGVLARFDGRPLAEACSATHLMTLLSVAVAVEDRETAAATTEALSPLGGLSKCEWNFQSIDRLSGGAAALTGDRDAARLL